jgi:hypothetical protein
MKLVEKNIGKRLADIGKDFLNMTPKHSQEKQKLTNGIT